MTRPLRHHRLGILAAAALATAACGGGGGEGGDQVASGQQVFEANCATCHGVEGDGTDTGPPLVHEVYEPSHHPDESFHAAVRNGVVPHHWEFGPMPAFPGVSEDEVDDVIAYVRQLQRDAGIE